MIEKNLIEYGVAICVIVVVLRLVLDFLLNWKKAKANGNDGGFLSFRSGSDCKRCEQKFDQILRLTENLWTMHDKYNDDGSPKWFVSQGQFDKINAHVKEVEKCQKILNSRMDDFVRIASGHDENANNRYRLIIKESERLGRIVEEMRKICLRHETILKQK